MNFIDIILIIVLALLTFGALALIVLALRDDEPGVAGSMFVTYLVIVAFICFAAWFTIDKKSGSTQGEITSVDKNFFGTTAVYIKVTETKEEIYCVEDENIAEIASNNIGNKVKVSYGTRVGFYSTGACNEAPISKIEILEN